jgi:hypothetical protein
VFQCVDAQHGQNGENDMSEIEGLKALQTALVDYFVPLAGASGLTVALLEAFKKLLSIRGRFHRNAVVRWLAQHDSKIPGNRRLSLANPLVWLHGQSHYSVPDTGHVTSRALSAGSLEYNFDEAYSELHQLTTGQTGLRPHNSLSGWFRFRGVDHAIFELEIARMMSQFQDASDAVLNNPNRYPALYLFLTRGCDGDDVQAWHAYMWKPGPAETKQAPIQNADPKVQADRYGRIRLLVRRQLDAFQVVTSNRWDELNQMWAIIVGAVILLLAQLISAHVAKPVGLAHPLQAIYDGWNYYDAADQLVGVCILSLLGGVLAPIAKDLVSSLSQIKFSK